MTHLSNYSEETGYVNIHGDDVKVLVCEKTGRIVVPIEEVKNMGFRIYRKSQYSKLLIDDEQFTAEFDLYMLQAAESYMLEHKMTFREEDILASISKAKMKLTGGSNASDFTKSHKIQSVDNNITVTANLGEPSALTIKNLQTYNKGLSQASPNFPNKRMSLQNDRKFTRTPEVTGRRSELGRNKDQFNGVENQVLKSTQVYDTVSNDSDTSKSNFVRSDLKSPEPRNIKDEKISANGDAVSRPKLPQIHLNNPVHNVIVAFVEKPNILWVQDVDNAAVLLDIKKKVKVVAELAPFRAKYELNKLYLTQRDGVWYRCKIIKFKPLTVFFVDYGNSDIVTQLKELSGELSTIPCQAAKITFNNMQLKPEVGLYLKIQIRNQYDNGTYIVYVLSSGSGSPPKSEPEEGIFRNKPEPMCSLEHSQKVLAVAVNEGKLIVRTKECYDKIRKIEKDLAEIEVKPVHNVESDQVLLCKKEEKLYRVWVLGMQANNALVDFLDYKETIKVDISSLRSIPERLASEPITYLVTPKIEGCNSDSDPIIQDLINSKAKMSVILTDTDFDLKVGEELLSDKLTGQSKCLGRPMLKDLTWYKPKLGMNQYLFSSLRSSEDLTFTDNETMNKYLDVIIKTEIDDPEPYEPVIGELCYGLFDGSYFRCVVLSHTNFRYTVHFIDFGNIEALKKEDLRKGTDEIKEAPIIAIPCKLTGIPSVESHEEFFKNYFEFSEYYDLNIKKFDGEKYEIEVPSLCEELSSA